MHREEVAKACIAMWAVDLEKWECLRQRDGRVGWGFWVLEGRFLYPSELCEILEGVLRHVSPLC